MEETFSSLAHPLPPSSFHPFALPRGPLAPGPGAPEPSQRRMVRRARRSVSPVVGALSSKHLSASGLGRAARQG